MKLVDTFELKYTLAIDARKSIAGAAASSSDTSNIKRITFNPGSDTVHASRVSKKIIDIEGKWKWKKEKELWLSVFPAVSCVDILDMGTLCSAYRLCGAERVNVKKLAFSPLGCIDSFCSVVRTDPHIALCELARDRCVEILVLRSVIFGFHAMEMFDIPAVVDVMPKLRNFCILFDTTPELRGPILKYILLEPAKPINPLLAITVSIRVWKSEFLATCDERSKSIAQEEGLGAENVDTLSIRKMEQLAVCEFHLQWKVIEVVGDNEFGVGNVEDTTVVAKYRQTEE